MRETPLTGQSQLQLTIDRARDLHTSDGLDELEALQLVAAIRQQPPQLLTASANDTAPHQRRLMLAQRLQRARG